MSIRIPPLPYALGLIFILLQVNSANANTKEQIMFSRYMKYQFCMERIFGQDVQGVYQKLGISSAMNRWGTTEPTLTSIARASDQVKKADGECRRQNSIENEVRPN